MRATTTQSVDLLAVIVLTVLACFAMVLEVPVVLRAPLGLALVLMLPGYSLLALLEHRRLPAPEAVPAARPEVPTRHRGAPLKRLGLALAVSLALDVLVGLLLNYTVAVTTVSVAVVLGVMTVGFAGGAALRRSALAPHERPETALPQARLPRGGLDRALAVALAIAIAITAVSAAYVLLRPRDAVPFTEVYLFGSDGGPGCLPVAYRNSTYVLPAEEQGACDGPQGTVVLGIVNHEGRTQEYWLRAVWTNETVVAGNRTIVHEAEEWREWRIELEDQKVPVEPDAAHEPQYDLRLTLPPPPGPGLWRLSFQVYLESPPPVEASSSFLESPDRRVHLWIESA